jgi:hypothetical protein
MRNNFLKIALALLVCFVFTNCKKNKVGGTAEIKGKVLHHAKAIAGASIFIKYEAKDFPGEDVGKYDTKVNADANGNFSIKVYKGDYYLYGYGEDKDIPSPYIVKGGTQVSIRNREVVEITLAITE